MIFDEGGPGSPNVGGGADEEQNHNDHAVKTEESTLNKGGSTIESLRSYLLNYKSKNESIFFLQIL